MPYTIDLNEKPKKGYTIDLNEGRDFLPTQAPPQVPASTGVDIQPVDPKDIYMPNQPVIRQIPDYDQYTALQKLKSLIGGLGTGATMGLMDYRADYPEETAPGYHGVGEFAGAFAPISAGMKVAAAPLKIGKPFVKRILTDVIGGGLYGGGVEAAKAIKGEDVDLKQIPITAGAFGALGAGIGGAGKLVSKLRKMRAKKAPVKPKVKAEAPIKPTPKIEKPQPLLEAAKAEPVKAVGKGKRVSNAEIIKEAELLLKSGKLWARDKSLLKSVLERAKKGGNIDELRLRTKRLREINARDSEKITRDATARDAEIERNAEIIYLKYKTPQRILRQIKKLEQERTSRKPEPLGHFANKLGYGKIAGGDYWFKRKWHLEEALKKSIKEYENQGKSIPPEVLKDYPDLVKKAPPKKIQLGGQMKGLKEKMKAVKPTEKPKPTKEPWEMTKGELRKGIEKEVFDKTSEYNKINAEYKKYIEEIVKGKKHTEGGIIPAKGYDFKLPYRMQDLYFRERDFTSQQIKKLKQYQSKIGFIDKYDLGAHPLKIQQALKSNKPVPRHVLEEYKGEAWADEALGKPVKPKPAPKEKVTYRHAGVTPEVVWKSAKDLAKSTKEIARSTKEIMEKARAKPEIRIGVEQTKKAMIEHDRQIRRGAGLRKLLKQSFEDAVPDKERQMLIMHAVNQQRNPKFYNQLSPQEKGVVKWMELELDKMTAFNKEHKITDIKEMPKGVRYLPGWWKNPKTGEPYSIMYGKLSKGLPQAKQKKFMTTEEGIKAGMEPASTNMGDIIGGAWESLIRAHNSRQMFQTIHNIKADRGTLIQLRKGKPLRDIRMIERWDLLNKQGLTEGYIRYSHPSLDKTMVFKDATGKMVRMKGAVGVHESIFPFVRAYMENPNYVLYDKLNFVSKSLSLANPVFHPIMLGMQELFNWRIPFKNIPRGLRLGKEMGRATQEGRDMRLLYQEGLEVGRGYEDLGYQNKFFEGANTIGKVGNVATWPITVMRDWVFKVVQPGMKNSFAYDKLQKIRPKMLKEGYTELQAAREAVKMADGHFSGEHWKRSMLETNRFMVKAYFLPEARRGWQRTLLSPTWQREHMLVAKNVMKSFMPDAMIEKMGLSDMPRVVKGEYRKYALSAIMAIGMADLYNLMATQEMDGKAKHIWDNPTIFSVRALWNEPSYQIDTGKLDKKGNRIMKTVKGGPAFVRPFKSIYEVAEWLRDPAKKWGYKVAPLISAFVSQFPGNKYRNYQGIEDFPQRGWDFILDVGTPISADQLTVVMKGRRTLKSGISSSIGFPASKLKSKDTKKQYYTRLRAIEKSKGRFSSEWTKVRNEFESMGFKFLGSEYSKY